MNFSVVEIDGQQAFVPSQTKDKKKSSAAIEALLDSAWPHFNQAVKAEQTHHIPEAFQAAYRALKLAPYSPAIVEFSLLLAIQHGDFCRAKQLIAWAEEVGMNAEWPSYRSSLLEAVKDWNRYLSDAAVLRSKYRADDVTPSYRELLLLADFASSQSGESLSNTEHAYLKAYGIKYQASVVNSQKSSTASSWVSRRTIVAASIACLLGVGIGLSGMWFTDSKTDRVVVDGTTTQKTSPVDQSSEAVNGFSQVNLLLAQGNPLKAHSALTQLETDALAGTHKETYRALQQATNQALYQAGVEAWQIADYSGVVRLLAPVETVVVGEPQRKYYYLGMAAAETGRDSLAVKSLERLQPHLGADYPHFEAQAAYTLVRLLPDAEAGKYARVIADKYPDTLYYNSLVRAHL